MKNSLPGITQIGCVPAGLLPSDITARAMAGVPVAIMTNVRKIKLSGMGTCEVESEYDNNSRIEKVKISFRSLEELPKMPHLAFIVKNAGGEAFVVGAKEKPYPVMEVDDSSGSPGGEPSVYTYIVTWNAKKALVKCAVL